MSRLSFVVLAVVALLYLSAVSSQSCGGAGYDLTSIAGRQLVYFDSRTNYTYSATICSNAVNASACPCVANTSFCQSSPGFCGTSLSSYSVANSTWYGSYDKSGVTQVTMDGEFCSAEGGVAGGYREASFIYICDASATTPRILNVSEVHTCFYTAYIATSAVCTRNNNAASGPYAGIGSTYYDSRCGGGAYDLSSLQTQDLFWSPTTATSSNVWFLRVCGSVSSPNCSSTAGQAPPGSNIPATQTAMLCQSNQNNPTSGDNAASFYVADQQLWTVTSTGLSMQIEDGRLCGTTFPRQTNINFVCDATATTPVLTGVVEVITCHYLATVRTNRVCSAFSLLGSTGAASSSSSAGAAQSSSSVSSVSSVSSSSAVQQSSTSSSSSVSAAVRSSSSSSSSAAALPSSSSSSSSAAVSTTSSSSSSSTGVAQASSSSSPVTPPAGFVTSSSPSSSSTGSSIVPAFVSSSSSSSSDSITPPVTTNGAASTTASAVMVAVISAVVALML